METGRTVILLNLENLYESLYDALNQVSFIIPHVKARIKLTILIFVNQKRSRQTPPPPPPRLDTPWGEGVANKEIPKTVPLLKLNQKIPMDQNCTLKMIL